MERTSEGQDTYGQRERRHKRTEETSPHRLDTEGVAHFLHARVSGCRRRVSRQPTSIENSTPPMGAPNATATPAAEAAVIMSRILPEPRELARDILSTLHTMTSSELVKQARDGVANAGCDVYRWSFLPD